MVRHPVSIEYVDAIRRSLWQQVLLIVFCALLLDGGRILRVCLTSTLCYWLLGLIVLIRSERFNARVPDRDGLLFLRWGYLPLFGLFLVLNQYMNRT